MDLWYKRFVKRLIPDDNGRFTAGLENAAGKLLKGDRKRTEGRGDHERKMLPAGFVQETPVRVEGKERKVNVVLNREQRRRY